MFYQGTLLDMQKVSPGWPFLLSPDAKYIVSGPEGKTLFLWSTDTGNDIAGSIDGHAGGVNCVTFSPDGTQCCILLG